MLLTFFPAVSHARPISYPGGWTLMSSSDSRMNRLHTHYSPSAHNSLGVVLEDERESKRYNVSLQWNHLLFRRNTPSSQANLYLMNQAGVAFEHSEKAPNIDLTLAGDWETRRYFTSLKLGGNYADTIQELRYHQEFRLGVAPYLANSGKLHTWLMLQFDYHPQEERSKEKFFITPLIRLFKGPLLGEFGVSLHGDPLFRLIYRH